MTEYIYRVGFDSRAASRSAASFRKEVRSVDRATKSLDKQAIVLNKTFGFLTATLGAYAGVAGFARVIKDVQTLEGINARIANLTGDLANEQSFLKSTAQELSTSYVTLAGSYSRLLPLQQAGLLQQTETRKITVGLANALAATGGSAVQLGQSIFGLAQGLSAGTLRAEELNQTVEPIPGLLQAMDRAAGLGAGGFRKLVLDGKVTSDFFRDTLIEALKDYEGAAAGLAGNIKQSFTRVQNEYFELVDALAAPINSALTPFANTLEKVLDNVGNNAESYIGALKEAAVAGVVLYGAKAVSELGSYGAKHAATFAQTIKTQENYTKAQVQAIAANKKFDSDRAAQQRRAAVANAEAQKQQAVQQRQQSVAFAAEQRRATAAAVTQKAKITAKRAEAAAAAQGVVSRQAEAVSEGELALAIQRRTQALTAAAVATARQNLLSATSVQQRQAAAAQLGTLSAAQVTANQNVTSSLITQSAAQKELDKAKRVAEIQANRLNTAKVVESKASTAASAAVKAESAAHLQLNAAKAAGVSTTTGMAVATAGLATGQTAAAVTTTRLTLALRAQAAGAVIATGANRALAASYAFLGGPLGVALLASYGIYKFIEAVEEQKFGTPSHIRSLEDIAENYVFVGNEAEEAARKTIELAKAELIQARAAAEAEAARIPYQNNRGESLLLPDRSDQVEELERTIEEAEARVARAAREFGETARKEAYAAARGRAAGASVEGAGDELIASLFPSDQKLRDLQAKLEQLRTIYNNGGISPENFKRGEQLLLDRIKNLKENTLAARLYAESQDEAADALADFNDIAGRLNPVAALKTEYLEDVKRAQVALKLKQISNKEYYTALLQLHNEHERAKEDISVERQREIRDLLNQDIDFSSVDAYTDRISALNRHLEDTPARANEIRQALGQLNEDFLDNAQGREASPTDDLQNEFDQRAAEIKAYRAKEGADVERANTAILALEYQRYGAIRELESAENQSRLETLQAFGDDLLSTSREASELERQAAIHRGDSIEKAEKDHQARLKVIRSLQFELADIKQRYEQGLITLVEYHKQVEEAEKKHGITLGEIKGEGFLNEYAREINFSNQLFDLYEQRKSEKSEQALDEAKQARQAADNATGAEKVALEKQAKIAEEYAKKRFRSEKRAGIAQARVQQAIAVVKAWTSGATIYDQIANAAVAFVGTQKVINDLKSQQFNGGSPIGGSGGGSTGSSSGGGDSNTVNGQEIGNGGGVTNVFVLSADEIVDNQKFADKSMNILKDMTENGVVGLNPEGEITVDTLGV